MMVATKGATVVFYHRQMAALVTVIVPLVFSRCWGATSFEAFWPGR